MEVYIPMINCGYHAGESPMIWNNEYFTTEEECENWIKENEDNFTMRELSGGIFPYSVDTSVLDSYKY